MTLQDVGILAGILTGLAGLVGSLVTYFVSRQASAERFAKIELKVDTLWQRGEATLDYLIRRGEAEAAQKGWGVKKSPLEITTAGLKAIAPFLSEFLPFYRGLKERPPPPPDDRELFLAFEQRFGDTIVERICIPNGVSAGACLVTILKACEDACEKRGD